MGRGADISNADSEVLGNLGAILVLGGHRQTLAVVRALGALGLRIIVGQEGGQGLAFAARSRWVDSVWRHPSLRTSEEAFIVALDAFLDANRDVRFVFPIGDLEIAALHRLRPRLPQSALYLMQGGESLTACRDKSVLLEIARELDVPLARHLAREDGAGLLEAADRIGYPCVVKPETEATQLFGAKAFIADDRARLEDALERFGTPPQRLIVQSYVHGHRHNLYFFAQHGRVRAALQARVIRTDRSDGTGYAVYGVTVPLSETWIRHAERLIGRLGYDGPGTLQFIDDPLTGRSCFLEINARLAGNHAVPEHFGLHLARWWVELLQNGRATIPEPFSYRSGVRFGWLYGDLVGLLDGMGRGMGRGDGRGDCGVRRWLRGVPRLLQTLAVGRHVTWSWRDPLPTLYLYGGLLKRRISGAA